MSVLQGFKNVDSETAMKKAVGVALKQSAMKDNSTQTSPVDKVDNNHTDITYRYSNLLP